MGGKLSGSTVYGVPVEVVGITNTHPDVKIPHGIT